MAIKIITDCAGTKQDAIRSVFSKRYKNEVVELHLCKGESFPTPLTWEDFALTTKKRFQWIKNNYENPDVFIATIQKGYYYSHGMWFLAACVGIAYPLLEMLPVMTSSVPVGSTCSQKKSLNLSRNMSDILKEEHIDWDKEHGNVYTLLTGEDEKDWLEQPLRHSLKAIQPFF